MPCPVCRFENFEGEDNCANCGADLRTADIPQPALEFHDTVLGTGSLPLAVLGDVIDRWIAGAAR